MNERPEDPGAAAPRTTTPRATDARREDERLLDHEYDGIREYDNPMPRWWLWILYATVVWAVLYFLNVIPGIGTGKGRIANYERDMAAAKAAYASAAPIRVAPDDDAIRAAARDPKVLAKGRETFSTTCASCHVADGGGNIGPNLTDDYWLHGGRPSDILHTITTGVPEKGMPAWGEILKPDQVFAAAAYVTTLRGTHPLKPKAPQGVEVEDDHHEEHDKP